MKYIVKHPGFDAEVIESESITLADMQHHVEGLITTAWAPALAEANIDMYANDEGLLMHMQPNIGYMIERHPQMIVGPVVLVGHDGEGETIGLTDDQIEKGLAFLKLAERNLGPILIRSALGI